MKISHSPLYVAIYSLCGIWDWVYIILFDDFLYTRNRLLQRKNAKY
jgi:hypothetical protein